MADLYLMCGICGSGKSYYAKHFAQANNFRYLNIDDCYAVLNGSECIHQNKFEVWQLFYRIIHKACELGQTVVVDTNAPYRSDREEFLNWFSDFDSHYLLWVNASPELAWKNNMGRTRKVPKESFDNVNKVFCAPTEDEPRGRAEWKRIVRIDNADNHFQPMVYIRGDRFPEEIKTDIEG